MKEQRQIFDYAEKGHSIRKHRAPPCGETLGD